MGFLNLLIAALIPVLEVLLVTGVGSFIALDKVNILCVEARVHLNNLVFFVFNPALVFSNLAKTITYESMVKLWFMPFNILITFVIGSLLGWVVIQITRAPSHLRGLVVGCCAAGNLGHLLLIMLPAVCKEKGSPFGDPDVCYTDGLVYGSLSMAISAIYLWSYVYNIVRISSSKSSREFEINVSSVSKPSAETSQSQPASCKELSLFSRDSALSENCTDQIVLPVTRLEEKAQEGVSIQIKRNLGTFLEKIKLKRLLAPSTVGAIVGFIVGLVPQIRRSIVGDTASLRVIQESASLVGDGAIPAVTLVMGGNLVKGLRGSGIQKFLIAGIVVARYVVLPLIGIIIVKGALRFGLVHQNPLYQFVLLLQFALPPAANIGTITQLFEAGESECSVIMLWTYIVAIISLTVWSTIFMWLVA